MQARVSLAALSALVALGACSADTAIVLSIHAVDAQAKDATRLEVYFGSGEVAPAASDEQVPAEWWRRATVTIDPTALQVDPTLGDRTYELVLTPSSGIALDAEVVYAVVGYGPGLDGEALVAFAHSDDFIRFGEGEIRRIDVPLPAFDPAAKISGVTASGCAWWNAPGRVGPASGEIRDRAIVPMGDADCDGYRADAPAGCQLDGDCDDGNPEINPSRGQDCSSVDTDCCAETAANTNDEDLDGWMVCQGDCADRADVPDMFGDAVLAKDIHPGQTDTTCNGVDETCEGGGSCDLGVEDPDGDGYVTCHSSENVTGSVRHSSCDWFTVPDCLEEGSAGGVPAAAIHPEAEDVECNGVDENCDRQCDEGGPFDGDGDGFRRCNNTGVVATTSSAPTCAPRLGDCDDDAPFGQPGAIELCDGIDSMCDDVFSRQPRACLPTLTNGCTTGTHACTEVADGQAAFSPCIPDTDGPILNDRLCLPCAAGDLLQCNDGRFRTCGIHSIPVGSATPCGAPLQEVPLPPCPIGICTWVLANGTNAGGWEVGLVAPGDTNTSVTPPVSHTGPTAALRARVVGGAAQAFIIKRTGATEIYEVVSLERSPQACAPVTCDGGG